MTCPTCLACEFGSEDSLRRLVRWQALQIERLTGTDYEPPDFDEVPEPEPAPEPAMDALFTVEALLGHEDIWRKPPRVAAPRLIERLASAGLVIKETA